MKRIVLTLMISSVLLGLAGGAQAASVFFDDFESGLSQWVGKSGGSAHNGQIVNDPLDSSNQVLNFKATVGGGDVFQSLGLSTAIDQPMHLSFDYLGVITGQEDESGGYIGIANGDFSHHVWLAGTGNTSGAAAILDNTIGQWQHVDIFFDARYTTSRVMIEDFVDPAFNAYFDNVSLRAVPAPAAVFAGMGLLGLLGLRRRRA